VREIKRARHMGFIAGEARPEKRMLRRLRQLDDMQLRQRLGIAADMTR
jgi:hypothetical protein